MSKERNMGKNPVSTTAIPGTEINNDLIMSAWIRQLQEEDDDDDDYFDTMIHSIISRSNTDSNCFRPHRNSVLSDRRSSSSPLP